MKYQRGKHPNCCKNGFKKGHKTNVGRVVTDLTKKNISIGKKGKSNGLSGKIYSEEHRKNISNGLMGKKRTTTISDATRKRMSDAKKGKIPKNLSSIQQAKRGVPNYKLMSEKNPAWKGGVTKIHRRIRLSKKYSSWRKSILQRDGYKCAMCNDDTKLEVDHYPKTFSSIIKKYEIKSTQEATKCSALWDTENNRTLCKNCHFGVTLQQMRNKKVFNA